MKIAFDCHVPFCFAHGGVQIQVEQTMAALKSHGVEVRPLPWWDDSISPDLIHFFGKPTLSYARLVKQKQIRLVVADLLTSQGSRTSWQRLPFRLVCLLDRLLGGKVREKLGWSVYDFADCCVCLTPWEASLVRNMYGARHARIEIVPNGVEQVFLQDRGTPIRGDHLVTTVTITPRKRVVEMVRATALASVKLRVIGKPYHPQDPYYLLFLQTLQEARPWVEYVGAMEDRAELAGEYRRAAGFVLLSSMESQSLSALEAAACGCPLLLSDLPWARSSFGTGASYAPVASGEKTAPFLQRFMEGLAQAPKAKKVASWDEVAAQLEGIYKDLTTSL
jgi:glycosyltransferase involved in cell wall biosynthesis